MPGPTQPNDVVYQNTGKASLRDEANMNPIQPNKTTPTNTMEDATFDKRQQTT